VHKLYSDKGEEDYRRRVTRPPEEELLELVPDEALEEPLLKDLPLEELNPPDLEEDEPL
jgi:hypothetical protein|tara:strand:- start:812 stop:988 length:177 start_codon:yes stop_codon:yes gene_type:complete